MFAATPPAARPEAGTLHTRARSLGLAFALAVAVLILTGAQAFAQTGIDPGIRCAAKIGPGVYEFYLPGAKVTDVNGNKWVCGPDGQWFKDYSALTVNSRFISPTPTTSLIYATSTTITFSSATVGNFALTPAEASVGVGERLQYGFSWTVPTDSWNQLAGLELRIGPEGSLLWLRFDEPSRTFSLLNPATGQFGPAYTGASGPAHAGSGPNVLTNGAATLYLSDSGFVTDGPTSPTVTLVLSLGFAPRAIGNYVVEVLATTHDGRYTDFERAGTLTITPRH
jgi:hypothetical protein